MWGPTSNVRGRSSHVVQLLSKPRPGYKATIILASCCAIEIYINIVSMLAWICASAEQWFAEMKTSS